MKLPHATEAKAVAEATTDTRFTESSLTLFERAYRRIAPRRFRKWRRTKRLKAVLECWGGSNLPPSHPLFFESMFREPCGLKNEFEIRLNNYPDIPFLVRAGTADPNPFRQIILDQQYLDIFELAPDAEVILDLGANVGYTTLWFAIKYPNATICSVEPLPSNYSRLRRQIELAGLDDRVITLQVAVDSMSGAAEFYQLQDGFFHTSGSLLPASDRSPVCRVERMTIEGILDRVGLHHADVVKMDIEGAEERIFRDDGEGIRRVSDAASVIALEIHGPVTSSVVHGFFSKGEWNYKVRGEITSFYRNKSSSLESEHGWQSISGRQRRGGGPAFDSGSIKVAQDGK